MATLYKKIGSPYYWMRFAHNGIRHQESTREKNHNAADKVMRKRIEQKPIEILD